MKELSKRERVEFLLAHYNDFWATLSVSDVSGSGEGITGFPRMHSHPSVVELERCLGLLYEHAPCQYRHVKAFYTCETRTVDVPVRRKAKKGHVTVLQRQSQPLVPSWVSQAKVRSGVGFVTSRFRGQVFFPDELLEVA